MRADVQAGSAGFADGAPRPGHRHLPDAPIAARNNMAAAPVRREPVCVAAEALDGN